MIKGLGDFIVVRSKTKIDSWAEVSKSIEWPAIGSDVNISHLDVSDTIKVAWSGGVQLNRNDSKVQIELSHVVGDTSIDDFINSAKQGFIGKFARVNVDTNGQIIKAYTDATRQIPLFWLSIGGLQAIATDLRLLTSLENVNATINQLAIYHHLNFSYIPTPFTIYNEINKLAPGSELTLSPDSSNIQRYWQPKYPEDRSDSTEKLSSELRHLLKNTVAQHALSDESWGCFLSGGTDSSAITGMLSYAAGADNTHAYSIGFDEEEFNELEYAKFAANHYGTQHSTLSIGADETLSVIDKLVSSYDEPFGNSSAIPTFYCAQLAHNNNHNIMIAGDGGDEVFGGNERYSKDYYFQKYYNMPSIVKLFGSTLRRSLSPVDNRYVNRVKNFLYRGSLANPERFYTDDSFGSDFFDTLLSPELRNKIDRNSSLDILHKHYNECDSSKEINRLMYIDLQMAIADNDLTKVNRAAKATGVSVLYPYLSPDLVQFMGTVPTELKVNGTKKRYLYKKAVKNILPDEIMNKKKQGFGLPVGQWFREDKRFKELLYDTLLSQKNLERGYFNSNFITGLISRHEKGAWDYTQELWLLLMLELWHQKYIDK